MQRNTPGALLADVLNRLPCNMFGVALHAIVERQTALDPRQQQQLLQGTVHAIGALLGVLQRLFTDRTVGHPRDLQVGLDRCQRAAQFMGGIVGQPALAFEGLANAQKQLVLGFQQRLQLTGHGP